MCSDLAVILSVSLGITALAQSSETAARPDRGLTPATSYAVSDIENINLTNGNMHLSIPLAALPPIAGGKLKVGLSAIYNSKLWDVVHSEQGVTGEFGCPSINVLDAPQLGGGGWGIGGGRYRLTFRNATQDVNYLRPPQDCDAQEWQLLGNQWWKLILITPDGAEHELRPTDGYQSYGGSRAYLHGFYKDTPNTINAPMRYYSFDGSHLWAVVNPGGNMTSWTVYLLDGTQIINSSDGIQRIKDTNGNSIKIFSETDASTNITTEHIQDELTGREIKYSLNPTGNNGQPQGQVWYQSVGGTWFHIDVNYGSTHVRGKLYKVGGECNVSSELDTYVSVLREIVFPTTEPGVAAQRFTFSYDTDDTQTATTPEVWWQCNTYPQSYTLTVSKGMGELTRMVTPSGAIVKYYYGDLANAHDFQDPTDIARAVITKKTIEHDGTTDTWNYNIGFYGGGTVEAPDGSSTGESVYPIDSAFDRVVAPGNDGKGGLSYRTSYSGEVVVERHWTLMPFSGANTEATGSIGEIASFNPVVDAEYTTLFDHSTPTPVAVKMAAKTFQYDFNGNLISQTDYNWFDPSLVTRDAQGVPIGVPTGENAPTVLRVLNYSYYNPATAASSTNVYAKRALATATPLILNALQETSLGESRTQFSYDSQEYGTPPTAGNVTKVSRLDNRGDADTNNDRWLETSYAYDTYGNKTSVTDPKNNVTQFFYEDATHALPTRVVVDPLNGTGPQTTTTTYDYATGLMKSLTDPNGNVSEVDYTNQLLNTVDPFGRPGAATGPAVTSNGATHRRKVKTIYEDNARRVRVESNLRVQGDGLLKSRATTDQLGRTVLVEHSEDGSSYSISARTVYEQMGRITLTSNPRRTAAAATDGWTRTTKDTLGRVVEVATFSGATQPPSSGTNGNWTGTVTTNYGFDSTTTVTDQMSKQRKSETDALGRLVQVIEDSRQGGSNYQTSYSQTPPP